MQYAMREANAAVLREELWPLIGFLHGSKGPEVNVLKITLTETQTENRWILQGELVGPWVHELRSLWRKKRRAHTGQKCILDLNDVTFIDKSGERLLRALCRKGAQLVASGVYTKHLVEKAQTKQRPNFRRLAVLLFAVLLITPTISPDCLPVRTRLRTTVHGNASAGNSNAYRA